jgi:hypothetical protein
MDNDEKMMQKIMEILIEMKAAADAGREERKAYQERMAADREESRKHNQELMARMEAIFDDNRKKAEEDRKAHQDKTAADRGLFGKNGRHSREEDGHVKIPIRKG